MPHLQLPRLSGLWIPDEGVFDMGDTKNCNCSWGRKLELWRTIIESANKKTLSKNDDITDITWYYYTYILYNIIYMY